MRSEVLSLARDPTTFNRRVLIYTFYELSPTKFDRAAGHTLTQQPYRIALITTAAIALITHYYAAILEREPEAGGSAFWHRQIGF